MSEKKAMERIARAIYERMAAFDPIGRNYPWVPNGNSDMQRRARITAHAVVEAFMMNELNDEEEKMPDPVARNLERLADHVETAQIDLYAMRDGMKKQTARLANCEEAIKRLTEALRNYRVAANGFAQTIRETTNTAYPWPALDIASEVADSALNSADALLDELRLVRG